MTAREYIARLEELVVSGRGQEALDFATKQYQLVRRELTAEDYEYSTGLLERARMRLFAEKAQKDRVRKAS